MIGIATVFSIQESLYLEIPKFKIQLSKNNCIKIVQDIENKSLDLFKTIKLQANNIKEVKEEIIINIIYKKQEWLNNRIADRVVGLTTS